MLLRLYHSYENPVKKTQDIIENVEDFKESFELPTKGDMPIRAQGSCWITHKHHAHNSELWRDNIMVHISTTSLYLKMTEHLRATIKHFSEDCGVPFVSKRFLL